MADATDLPQTDSGIPIKRLYDGMDPSLRFQPTTEGPALAESAAAAKPPAAAAATSISFGALRINHSMSTDITMS